MTLRKPALFLLILILLGALGWLGVKWETSSQRPIDDYQLTQPLKQLTQAEIDAVMQPYLGASFWGVELNKIQADLQRLDWVSQAVVKRSWPDQLKITLIEQQPVARWGEDGLINQHGEVFFPRSINGFEQFVRLDGRLENAAALLLKLAQFQQALKALDWAVARLHEAANGVWEIEMANGTRLILDRRDETHKLQRFIASYGQLQDSLRNSAQVFDLRYSNGFAVKRGSAAASVKQ
jgi:cell division protein FtsQ